MYFIRKRREGEEEGEREERGEGVGGGEERQGLHREIEIIMYIKENISIDNLSSRDIFLYLHSL